MSWVLDAVAVDMARAMLQKNRNLAIGPAPQACGGIAAPPGQVKKIIYNFIPRSTLTFITLACCNSLQISINKYFQVALKRFVPGPPPTLGCGLGPAQPQLGGCSQQVASFPPQLAGCSRQPGTPFLRPNTGRSAPLYGAETPLPSSTFVLDERLERQLASIPVPCPCPAYRPPDGVSVRSLSDQCGAPGRGRMIPVDPFLVNCYQPQAGPFSDGIGGLKIKCSQDPNDRKGMGLGGSSRGPGNQDGFGGSKVKSSEE